MRKDKQFKAKNRDTDFSKPQVTDTVLGRHNQPPQKPEVKTPEKKNRLYRQDFTEPEKQGLQQEQKQEFTESKDAKLSDTVHTVTENSEQDSKETGTADTDIKPQSSQVFSNETYTPKESPKASSFSSVPHKPISHKKQVQRKQVERYRQETVSETVKNADNIPQEQPSDNTARDSETVVNDVKSKFESDSPIKADTPIYTDGKPAADIPPPKSDRYDISEAAKSTDSVFDRVADKKTDFQLGKKQSENFRQTKTEHKAKLSQSKKNRLYQKEQKKTVLQNDKTDKPADISDTDISSADIITEKETVSGASETKKADISEVKKGADKGIPDTDISEDSDFQFTRTRKEKKADRLKSKADKAESKLPHKTKIKRKRIYDEQKKKPKTRLQFEKEVKPLNESNRYFAVKNARSYIGYEVINKAHTKIREVENDNSSVEAAHKTEQQAERLMQHSMRTKDIIKQKRKNAPYAKAERLKRKAENAEVKALYEKALKEHPELKKSALKKFVQKQRIKKNYQKAKRAEETAKKAKKAAEKAEAAASRLAAFVWRHKAFFGIVITLVLLVCWLGSVLSSCSIMGTTGGNALMVSSYFAEDSDIYAAEDYYISLERNLQSKVDNIESTYAGYDEYNYNIAGIGHNPYELISYLTAVYQDFTFSGIKSELDTLFNEQYHLQISERSETRTDADGNEYTYKILNVTLTNSGFTSSMNAEQQELYAIYLETKGNRDYLFADDIYSNIAISPYNDYTIPSAALSDETFRKLITEAEKYLGYPYVWGGSSPSTSFDCSGFVCWVFRNSGVYPLSRTTAQGIYNQCARVRPQDAKPGDIIFFTGTYRTSDAVTHVGIYVGNNMMIHCGNPIQYASTQSSYWTQHFYAYGRLSQ